MNAKCPYCGLKLYEQLGTVVTCAHFVGFKQGLRDNGFRPPDTITLAVFEERRTAR